AADDRVRARADAGLAAVALGAGIAVVAARTVGGRRIRALAALRIARAGHVTLIEGGADDRISPRADAGLAAVALGAGAALVTRRAAGGGGVGALAALRVAGAGGGALVGGGADDRLAADAAAGLAGIAGRAGVAVAAGGPVGGDRVGALAVLRVAGAG